MSYTEESLRKKLIYEQNLLLANERIASAASNEKQWLESNRSLFASTRKVELLRLLTNTPEARQIDENLQPEKIASATLKITLPIVWIDGNKTTNSLFIDKSTNKKTNIQHYYVFFEVSYKNNIYDTNGNIIDTSKCVIPTFTVDILDVSRDTKIQLIMWVWAYNPSDFKKNKLESKISRHNSLNSVTSTKQHNFIKYGSMSFLLNDAIDKPYINTLDMRVTQYGLVNFMEFNNHISVTCIPFPKELKYSDLHPYVVYLNENLKCYIGFKDHSLYFYPDKFSNEPLNHISFDITKISKYRFDSKNKRVVKIKYGQNTHAFHFQSEEIAKIFIQKLETFPIARNEWGQSVCDFNKLDLPSLLADIVKIPTTYMEYIDKSIENFSTRYENRKGP